MTDKEIEEAFQAAPLPPWAIRASDGDYLEIGAQLCTKDGRRCGNAYVEGSYLKGGWEYVKVVTDMGTVIYLTLGELQEMFHPPVYLMAIEAARAARGYYPEEAIEPVRLPDGSLQSFLLRVAGKPFRCSCGSNVLHKPDKNKLELYKCNGCGATFE